MNLTIQPFLVPFIQFPSFRQRRHMLVASKSPSWLNLHIPNSTLWLPPIPIFTCLPHHFFPRSTCAPPDALGVAVGLQHGLQVSRHPIESIQLDAAGNRRAVQGHGVEILVLAVKPMETNGNQWDHSIQSDVSVWRMENVTPSFGHQIVGKNDDKPIDFGRRYFQTVGYSFSRLLYQIWLQIEFEASAWADW